MSFSIRENDCSSARRGICAHEMNPSSFFLRTIDILYLFVSQGHLAPQSVLKIFFLISSKKHLAVAFTSADASCASEKPALKSI